MARQSLRIQQQFNAPLNEVFDTLSDHERFGRIIGVKMKRVKTGDDGANGLGSIRTIHIGPLPSFEETITGFEPNALIEYKITKGSPIKNHVGTLRFSENNGVTELDYTIELESKIPLTTGLIKTALHNGIAKGLKRYSESLQ
ncbi:MAG: SRPBCC family protein [Oleiphilaceae bacterium]|nr:SRPBCC family protein [Oleiphilaceae bacterium]